MTALVEGKVLSSGASKNARDFTIMVSSFESSCERKSFNVSMLRRNRSKSTCCLSTAVFLISLTGVVANWNKSPPGYAMRVFGSIVLLKEFASELERRESKQMLATYNTHMFTLVMLPNQEIVRTLLMS